MEKAKAVRTREARRGRWCGGEQERPGWGDLGAKEGGGGGKRGWRGLGESRSRVVPSRNHRRRRPLVWKNDSSVLTECPCFCPPLGPLWSPYGGGFEGVGGGWLPLRGWRNAGDGGAREGDEMPAPDSLIAAAQLCVPLWRSVKLSLPLSFSLSRFPSPPLSLSFSLSFPRLLCRGCCGPRCNDVSCI